MCLKNEKVSHKMKNSVDVFTSKYFNLTELVNFLNEAREQEKAAENERLQKFAELREQDLKRLERQRQVRKEVRHQSSN